MEKNYKKNFVNTITCLLASWFFIGFAPLAPGTIASITAIPLCLLFSGKNIFISIIVLIFVITIVIFICDRAEKFSKTDDPKEIVIDEVVGMIVAMFALQFTLKNVIISFIIFRLLDIFKFQPIKLVEKKLKGGLGIVLDDVFAGILSNLISRVILLF